ncbi:hypothetical protein AMQ83_17680 [Paenibacillus riograndensis]|nr:hypothetical protein AMQ83_17680 [Paenibacillus riograndensis]
MYVFLSTYEQLVVETLSEMIDSISEGMEINALVLQRLKHGQAARFYINVMQIHKSKNFKGLRL